MKTAKLIRKYTPSKTDGFMLFDNIKIKTIERPWLDNRPMVSCIPEGQYLCRWSHMAEHNVDHYQLQKVPDRSAIFIHIATKPDQLHGCIGSDRLSIQALENWANKEDFNLIVMS